MDTDQPGTRERILQSAYNLFYREGFSRVSVDAIAERASVTKRTIYYHFKSKDDIVAEVLDDQHQYMMQQFRKWAGPGSTGAADMIDNLFAELKRWADGPTWLGSGFTRITTELADMPGHPARKAASRHKSKVENWLADRLERHGIATPDNIARQIMVLVEGAMSLSLIHGNTRYMESSAAAAKALLAKSTP